MKILFISQYFYPEPFSNSDIARELVRRGHSVDVICCVPNYPEGRFYAGFDNRHLRREMWAGVSITRARTVPRGQRALGLMSNYLTFPPAALFAWFSRRAGRGHDVTFTSMPSPIFQGLVAVAIRFFRGTPAVFWVQDVWPDSLINTIAIPSRMVRHALLKFCSWVYRQADIVMIQSEAFRPKLVAMGVEPHRIRYFPNTSPDALRSRTPDKPAPAAAQIPPAKLRLMFAGNIGESQNLDVYIDAALRLPKSAGVQWVIVGDGRDLPRVRDRVSALGLQDCFIFTGRQPMETMPQFYALADAMLVSLKDTDVFAMTVPFKLQSYLALGKPVIGSISGETRRIIEESGAGFCAPADDAQQLCEAIERFCALSDSERAASSSNAVKYYQKHFESGRVYSFLEDALELAVRQASSRA